MYEATLTVMSVTGIYLLLGAFLMNTENTLSAFIFKFIPFVLGAALIYLAVEVYRAPETVFGDTPAQVGYQTTQGPAQLLLATNQEWVPRKLEPLKENPNCVLYSDPCPLELPDATQEADPGASAALIGTPGQCITRLRLPAVDHPGTRCILARNEIGAYRPLIGVIGAETLFEASETPIWKDNRRTV